MTLTLESVSIQVRTVKSEPSCIGHNVTNIIRIGLEDMCYLKEEHVTKCLESSKNGPILYITNPSGQSRYLVYMLGSTSVTC